MDNIASEASDVMINQLNFGKQPNTSLVEDKWIIFRQGLMSMPQMLEISM